LQAATPETSLAMGDWASLTLSPAEFLGQQAASLLHEGADFAAGSSYLVFHGRYGGTSGAYP